MFTFLKYLILAPLGSCDDAWERSPGPGSARSPHKAPPRPAAPGRFGRIGAARCRRGGGRLGKRGRRAAWRRRERHVADWQGATAGGQGGGRGRGGRGGRRERGGGGGGGPVSPGEAPRPLPRAPGLQRPQVPGTEGGKVCVRVHGGYWVGRSGIARARGHHVASSAGRHSEGAPAGPLSTPPPPPTPAIRCGWLSSRPRAGTTTRPRVWTTTTPRLVPVGAGPALTLCGLGSFSRGLAPWPVQCSFAPSAYLRAL